MLLFVAHVSLCLFPATPVPLLPSFLVLSEITPFIVAFVVGAAVHVFRERVGLGRPGAVATGVLCALILKFGGWSIFGPVLLPLFVLNLAFSFQVRLAADLSYGMYVLHFPCEQVLAGWHLQRHGFATFFLCSFFATAACAAASWYLVERPALRLK